MLPQQQPVVGDDQVAGPEVVGVDDAAECEPHLRFQRGQDLPREPSEIGRRELAGPGDPPLRRRDGAQQFGRRGIA